LHGAARITLLVAGVSAPVLAGLAGNHRLPVGEQLSYQLQGSGVVLMGVGLLALVIALVCHGLVNQNDPEAGPGLLPELFAALRGVTPGGEEEAEEHTSELQSRFDL